MSDQVSFSEALAAMIAMCIVLAFVLIYFCFIPAYRAWKRRKYERDHFWETDPRWNAEKFMFTPHLPKDYANDKKYSRMACSSSRSSRYSDM